MEVGPLGVGVFGMAGHGDVAESGLFVQGGGQLAGVQQPALQLGGGLAARGASFQEVEERGDLGPVAEVNLFRDKSAGTVGSQFIKGQQIHFSTAAIFAAGGGGVEQF